MRILVGTVEIAGMIPTFADGFRQLGHSVTSVISSRHPFYQNIEYDVDLNSDVIHWPDAIANLRSRGAKSMRVRIDRLARLARLMNLITEHDLFVFQWAGGTLRWNTELPLLKMVGKRVVSLFCGDDVRHSSAYNQDSKALLDNRMWVPLQDLPVANYHNDPLTRPLSNVRVAEKYSDLIISAPSVSGLQVRPYLHFFVPVNLSEFTARVPGRQVPVIVHAPSDNGVKGTAMIVACLEQLRLEGVSFEFRLLQGVSNPEVLSNLIDADVVIDQLHLPIHGKLGVEAMASGCALATCNREEYEPFPPNRPIWHVGPENLYAQLKQLLTDKDLRIQLAYEGRSYVERYHGHVQVTRRILDAVNSYPAVRYDHYPTLFARSYQVPSGEVISEKLKRMTAEIVQKWGLPEDVDVHDMIHRGLMSADALKANKPIPRWKPRSFSAEAALV